MLGPECTCDCDMCMSWLCQEHLQRLCKRRISLRRAVPEYRCIVKSTTHADLGVAEHLCLGDVVAGGAANLVNNDGPRRLCVSVFHAAQLLVPREVDLERDGGYLVGILLLHTLWGRC